MENGISINRTEGGRNVVRARELHALLGSGRDFPTWIGNRIRQYGFVENQDFRVFPGSGENPQGGRPAKEYSITLDMARELAKAENSERGRAALRYFAEWENNTKIPDTQCIVKGSADSQPTMTSREIAEITGKEHRNVLRDCDKLNKKYAEMSLLKIEQDFYKADNGQSYRELHLTRMQTLDLMTGYDMGLRIKVNRRWEELERQAAQPQIKDPQIAAVVLALREIDGVKQEQERLAAEQERQSRGVAELAERLSRLEAMARPDDRYHTVVGWAKLHGRPLPGSEAARLGRLCAEASRKRGVPIGDVGDPRFGSVHCYADGILEEVFGNW